MIILEKHPVSGYEPRHYRREPDDVLTRRVDVDIDMDAGRRVIRVERAVVRAAGGFVVGPPKSDAGRRTVAIPPHLVGGSPSTSPGMWGMTRTRCCSRLTTWPPGPVHALPALLRRRARLPGGRTFASTTCGTTGAVLAASTGCHDLAELMGRLGHSTPAAACAISTSPPDVTR